MAPAGPNGGLEREYVAEIQRARMLAAMAEVAAELGANKVTVAHVVERAGVSRRTFYELFDDCRSCFLAAFEEGVVRVSDRVLSAYGSADRWRDRIRASLIALLSFLDDEPFMARLLVVESLGGGPEVLARRSCVCAHLIAAVDEGRKEGQAKAGVSHLAAEGVVGAVFSVIHGRMTRGDPRPLVELVNPLMSMIVLPYLGSASARRELDRSLRQAETLPEPAQASARMGSNRSNPLKELQMRLTYRTVRVLVIVASAPGSSNRMLGDAAGIDDQGQISKLLARLERLGLIENAGAGSARGEPNAWVLTERGEEVHDAIAAQVSRV
jgi:AcrR family transcriptional regulator